MPITIKNPNLNYLGFYDYGKGDPGYASFSNVVIADLALLNNQADIFHNTGVKVILSVGDYFFRYVNPPGKKRVCVRRDASPGEPPPEWTAVLPDITAYQDIILGLYDIDEPVNKTLHVRDSEWAEGFMRADCPWAKIMVNYGKLPGRLPSTADWISFSVNTVDGSLVEWNAVTGNLATITSLLLPNQFIWFITPAYGTPTNNGDSHDILLVQRVNDYFVLANEKSSRAIGIIGWLWPRVEDLGTVFSGLGSKRTNGSPKLPKTLARYTRLGKLITGKA